LILYSILVLFGCGFHTKFPPQTKFWVWIVPQIHTQLAGPGYRNVSYRTVRLWNPLLSHLFI